MSCGVYKITNTVTNESYIGSSKNIEKRWKNHKSPSNWKRQPNNMMYQDMQQYGVDKFIFSIIGLCEESELKQKEDFFIQSRKPAYNKNRAYLTDEEKTVDHLKRSLKHAELYKDDPKEKERRNRNSNAWKERNREKAREAVRRWKAEHSDYKQKKTSAKTEYDKQWREEQYHQR